MKTVTVKNVKIGEGLPKVALPVVSKKDDYVQMVEKAQPDLIEFRADAFSNTKEALDELARLRAAVPDLPVLFTFRTQREGGNTPLSEADYADLLRNVARKHAADLVDLEWADPQFENLLSDMHAAGVPVVASNHDFNMTPEAEEIFSRLKKMEEAGADIVKAAFMPKKEGDVRNVISASLESCQKIGAPHLLISMGKTGEFTRTNAEFLGSAFTFGCLPGEASAPGQIDTVELRRLLEERHQNAGKHIFLIGFMGTGKTTVAKELSNETAMPMMEMDQEIERRSGKKISEIFAEEGETHFRDLETDLLLSLADAKPCIVSCGGGAILREVNRMAMKRLGRVICLEASAEELFRRLVDESDNRPNMKGRLSVSGIEELLNQRRPMYDDAADFHIMTDGRTIKELISEIRLKIFHCEQ